MHAMYPEKEEAIMSAAPQLMLRCIQIHQQGAYKPCPAEIERLTAGLWADAAPENPLQEHMTRWYGRCNCTPGDPEDDTTAGLVDSCGSPCTHTIKAKDIMTKMKAKKLESGEDLYKHIKGRSRSEAPILEMLQRVHLGSPALRLVCKERHGEERSVFFGLVPSAGNAFQQIMPAALAAQFGD